MIFALSIIGIFTIWLVATITVADIDGMGILAAIFTSLLYMVASISVVTVILIVSRSLWLEVVRFVG